MPALPKLRTRGLAELAHQLRFGSPEAARRQLERAEALGMELLTEQRQASYPLEYIVFRITGLRREGAGASEMILLEALLADLPALVERLSTAARLTPEDLRAATGAEEGVRRGARGRLGLGRGGVRATAPGAAAALSGPWLTVEELSKRWSVGRKTIERMRRRGLLSRRVRTGTGEGAGGRSVRGAAAREQLVFAEAAVRAFEASGLRPVEVDPATGRTRSQVRAARAARLTAAERAKIARRAGAYQRRLGWSPMRAAARVSAVTGRSVETVRRVMQRAQAEGGDEARGEGAGSRRRGRMSRAERAQAEQAARAGAAVSRAAARLGRGRATIYRAGLAARIEALRGLDLDAPVGPVFDRAEAREVLLEREPVRTGLGAAAPLSVGAFVAACESMGPPAGAVESARAVAICYLRYLARGRLGALRGGEESAAAVDEIETMLRWASRLKAELVREQMPVVLRSIRARLGGRGPESLPTRGPVTAATVINACMAAVAEAVERFDPFKAMASGGRLAAPATIAVNRALTRVVPAAMDAEAGAPGRAAAKVEPQVLADWTRRVDAWQAWLEPPRALADEARAARGAAGPSGAPLALRVAAVRYGLWGDAPVTAVEAAKMLGTTPTRITAIEHRAARAAAARERGR